MKRTFSVLKFSFRARWIAVAGIALALIGIVGAFIISTRPPLASVARPSGQRPFIVASAPGCHLIRGHVQPPLGAEVEFRTNWSKHCVPYSEILSGGPIRDEIPPIDAPKFISVDAADSWLKPAEPVIFVQIGADARAYPIQILIWHEVVNDHVGGVPLVITFCPLCNTAIAFERTVSGHVLDFGTTGRLRYSNLLMYDRQTESWWQQAIGQAIVGDMAGVQLAPRSTSIISWAEFKMTYPDGRVLSRDTGSDRPYGQNPYPGYDNIHSAPFLYQGPQTPGTLPQMARVLAVTIDGAVTAYPFDTLKRLHVINDTIGGKAIVVFWTPGASSPVDGATTAGGQDVGSAVAFASAVDGRTLTFTTTGATVRDDQTGSTWDSLGRAISGPLVGHTLTAVQGVNAFWFAWVAFQPSTRVYHT